MTIDGIMLIIGMIIEEMEMIEIILTIGDDHGTINWVLFVCFDIWSFLF